MTRQQRRNARQAAAQASKTRHQEPPPDIDWDETIDRFKVMLDSIESTRQ
jgi:hypothetical protein